MKRRDFIKALPIIAISPYFQQDDLVKPIHLIALGSAATRTIEKLATEIKFDKLTFINDKKPKNLSQPYTFISYHPPESAFTYFDRHKILKNGPLPEITLSESIRQRLDSVEDKWIVFAALGSFTGTTHYHAIAKSLSSRNIDAHFICTWPFEFEGRKRMKSAQHSSGFVGNLNSQQIFQLEHIRLLYGNLSIRSAFEKAEEWVLNCIKKSMG